MQDNVKSALVVGRKESEKPEVNSGKAIEYKQVANLNDYVGELSDQEKEAEFHRQHEQYMKMKAERKKQLIQLKRQEFGSSSSSDSDGSSNEEIGQVAHVRKVESKRSKAKTETLSEQQDMGSFIVLLEAKKNVIQTELLLKERDFQLNKRTFPYPRINRLAISKISNMLKVRIGILGQQEISLSLVGKGDKDKPTEAFLKLLRLRLSINNSSKFQKPRANGEQLGPLREGAIICDRILKKSQYFGKWEERYIVIRSDGLYSYRTVRQKPTMVIHSEQLSEFSTQFEYYKQTLVMKLQYNNDKTDFGLPIDSKLQWVAALLRLLL